MYEEIGKTMFGRLSLSSDPYTCTVYLDDAEIGSTPLEGIYVPVGDRTLRFSKFNYGEETLDITVEPGAELEHMIVLSPYREASTLAVGVEFGLSLVSLNYSGGTTGPFLGMGIVEEQESMARFGAGAFLHMYRHDRLAVQAGLRYITCGNKVYFRTSTGGKSSPYYTHYRYLALPVLVRYYVIQRPRIHVIAGLEFAFMIGADISNPAYDETVDLMEIVQDGQVSLTVGAGYEIGVAGHFIMISAYHTMGMLSLRNSGVWNQIDYKPREWRIALSFIFTL
jgi:hypothetical protein